MEIFIHKFDRKDREAMRDMATESKRKIGGLHLYACKNLWTWFRYGEYLIKWDDAVWMLGLMDGLRSDQMCVRYGIDGCSIDFIAELIIGRYGEDFNLGCELMAVQQVFTSTFVHRAGRSLKINFDYKKLLKEPARYQHILRNRLLVNMYGNKPNRYLKTRDNRIYWNCLCSGKGCEKGETCSRTELFNKEGCPEFDPMKTVIVRSCIAKKHKYYLENPRKKGGEQ